MKNLFKIFSLMFLFLTMVSFISLDASNLTNTSTSEVKQELIRAYEAEKNGMTAYFNSKQCAINAGFTLTGNVAMLPPSQVFTCI